MNLLLPTMCIGIMCTACSKPQPEPIQQYDTFYYFARDHYEELCDLEQISASVDSVEVRYIIFQVKKDNWSGVNFTAALKNVIEPAFEAAKGKGRGTFNYVDNDHYSWDVEDRYNELGYTFEYYKKTKTH